MSLLGVFEGPLRYLNVELWMLNVEFPPSCRAFLVGICHKYHHFSENWKLPLENAPSGLSTALVQAAGKCTEHEGFPPGTNTARQGVITMELKSSGTFTIPWELKKRSEGLSKSICAKKYSRYQWHWQFAYWLVWVRCLYCFETSFDFKLNWDGPISKGFEILEWQGCVRAEENCLILKIGN